MDIRALLSILLVSVLCCSCQDEKSISETLIGEWTYERETSNTFNYLLDFDRGGIISFESDGTGVWNDSKGKYNFDLEWISKDASQNIEIIKFDQDNNLEFVKHMTYQVVSLNDQKIEFEFKEETLSTVDPSIFIIHFENITLTRK